MFRPVKQQTFTTTGADLLVNLRHQFRASMGNGLKEIFFTINNTGAQAAYMHSREEDPGELTADVIPAGEARLMGPYVWPGGTPDLLIIDPSTCKVVPKRTGG